MSSTGHSSCRGDRRCSRRARQPPYPAVTIASGHAIARGISLANTEQADSSPSAISAPITQRDGRHSRRQGADVLDERIECGIGRGFMAKEPAPEPIVLAVQQA